MVKAIGREQIRHWPYSLRVDVHRQQACSTEPSCIAVLASRQGDSDPPAGHSEGGDCGEGSWKSAGVVV